MINDFLVQLDNNQTPPAGFIWPMFEPRVPTPAEAAVRAAVIGINLSREQHFSRCLQLVDVVAESPLSSYITAKDPRLTYTRSTIRSRFAISGPVVLYTGTRDVRPSVNLAVMSSTPDIGAWVLQPTALDAITISDDRGISTTASVTFADGISNPISLPAGGGIVQLVGTDISTSDTWQLSYRAPGASWITLALSRLANVEPRTILTTDLAVWYNKDPLALDKLAAVVAALGSIA